MYTRCFHRSLLTLIKRKADRCFVRIQRYRQIPQEHRPPAFLFLSQRCQSARHKHYHQAQKPAGTPLRTPGLPSHLVGCDTSPSALNSAASLSDPAYMATPTKLSSIPSQKSRETCKPLCHNNNINPCHTWKSHPQRQDKRGNRHRQAKGRWFFVRRVKTHSPGVELTRLKTRIDELPRDWSFEDFLATG
jgi:hypothetical protein